MISIKSQIICTCLIQGIWWSTTFPTQDHEGYLRGIKLMEFSFPALMGDFSFETRSIENVKKEHDPSQNNKDIIFFTQPILTESLSLSELAFATNDKKLDYQKAIRFSLELYGCSDYQPDLSIAITMY